MNNLSTRQFQGLVLAKLDEQHREIRDLRQTLDRKLEAVLVSPKNDPIPRPIQGKNTKRSTNVARTMRAEIEARNERISKRSTSNSTDSTSLYLEFAQGIPDTRLNSDAMRVIESVLRLRLEAGWETMRWNEIYNCDKRKGEQVIQEASRMPELAVFSQASNQWAIRMLAEQRTYTIQKTVRKSMAGDQNKIASHVTKAKASNSTNKLINNRAAHNEEKSRAQDHFLRQEGSPRVGYEHSTLRIDINDDAVDVVRALSVEANVSESELEVEEEDQGKEREIGSNTPLMNRKNIMTGSRESPCLHILKQSGTGTNEGKPENKRCDNPPEKEHPNNAEKVMKLLSNMDPAELQNIAASLSENRKRSIEKQAPVIRSKIRRTTGKKSKR